MSEIKANWTPLPVILKKGDIVYSKDDLSVLYEVIGTGFAVVEDDSRTKTERCLKDRMIDYIKQVNSNPDISKHITKLYYEDENAERKCVTDYSTFIDYMSEELQESLKYGRTLTKKLEDELNYYRIERFYKPEIEQPNVEKLVTIGKPEVILSQKDTQKLLKVIGELRSINIL
ncbi:hypothetical protein [Paenibacillus sp. QZ-Y1]|uniref:hypothetical protein n=1 Tax=Paenibacillus sp. QZ-Y1 TaxID=3414511 RepID=UPI003F7B1336